MCSSSRSRVWALDAGMTKLESSANLNISFPAVFGRRSDAVTMYANGPRPEPWMMLAIIALKADSTSLNFVQCVSGQEIRSPSCKHLEAGRGGSVSPQFFECLTVSNALLKSSAITMTYSFVSNKFEIVCSIAMRAAVVDPDGLNANWSSNVSELGGEMSDGYNSSLTTIFSIIRDITGVIEIGR